jgi:serine/threonine protein kinase
VTTRAIPNPGDVVSGQYALRREIGRGSMGVVFEAHQLGLERRVAVKMLLPDALRHNNVIDRFKREARLASSINHPSLVTIHAFGVDPLPTS